MSLKSFVKGVTKVATIASFIPGPIGMVATGIAVAGNLAQGKKKEALLAAAGGMMGAARLLTKASAIARVAKATKFDGNAGFGALKAHAITAKLAGKMFTHSSGGLNGFRIGIKASGQKVANFERFLKRPVSNRLARYPNRTQNLHLSIGGWLW